MGRISLLGYTIYRIGAVGYALLYNRREAFAAQPEHITFCKKNDRLQNSSCTKMFFHVSSLFSSVRGS